MIDEELCDWYFDWMLDILYYNAPFRGVTYTKLLRHLHSTPFRYIIRRDANRLDDGLSLRNRFIYDNNLNSFQADSLQRSGPCSVLEMMTALSIRCEDEMMDPYKGDQTARWFWSMIHSLGLYGMTDRSYDEFQTEYVIQRFLNREYSPDGRGGLFTIENCNEDLRTVEIWYQLNWYLCSM